MLLNVGGRAIPLRVGPATGESSRTLGRCADESACARVFKYDEFGQNAHTFASWDPGRCSRALQSSGPGSIGWRAGGARSKHFVSVKACGDRILRFVGTLDE